MSFPRKRESIAKDCKISFKINWTPAYAGMTAEWLQFQNWIASASPRKDVKFTFPGNTNISQI